MEQQDLVTFGDITPTAISDTGDKIILNIDKLKLSFFKNKKDGGESKAYTAFKAMNVQANQPIKVGVAEKPASFTDDKGVTRNFFYHSVIWIGQADGQSQYQPPVTTQQPAQQPQQAPDTTPEIPPTQTTETNQTEEIDLNSIPF